MSVQISVVDGRLTRELRRAVLRPTWPPGTGMHGDEEPSAVHLAAYAGETGERGEVVGTCVLLPRPYPRRAADGGWQLRGMATAPGYRGRGIGSAIVSDAVSAVLARGGRLLWCEARESAIAFYTRHGFLGDGELYVHAETAIMHCFMYRELFSHAESSTS